MKVWLNRVWWRGVRRIGVSGMVAVVLLLPAASLFASLQWLHGQGESLRASLLERARDVAAQGQTPRRQPSPSEQLGNYIAGFPPVTQNSIDLEQVFAAAQARGISLPKGDYQLKSDPGTSLLSFTATFPVKHDYAAVKGFTADVLSAMPHVSMDELRMARSDAGSGTLDSIVRFTFLYRNP